MKKHYLSSILLLAMLCLSCGQVKKPNSTHFYMDSPAQNWYEALPIGNGHMGAMIFGGVGNDLIQLNEDTFWAGAPRDLQRPGDYKNLPKIRQLLLDGKVAEAEAEINAKMLGEYNFDYMPLADLVLKFEGDTTGYTDYRRELDFETGSVVVTFRKDGSNHRREYFVSYPDRALVIKLSADGSAKLDFEATLTSQVKFATTASQNVVTIKGQAPAQTMPEYTGDFAPIYNDSVGMFFEGRLMVESVGGRLSASDGVVSVKGADEALLKFVTATSFNGFDKDPVREGRDPAAICESQLSAVATKSFDDLRAAHVADFGAMFNRVSIDLGSSEADDLPINQRIESYEPGKDPSLTALYYQFGRYLLMSSSRAGSQPANLQGIWNKDLQPEWSSNYTTNCNVELNYMNAEQGNLSECHLPLFDMIRQASVDGAKTARNMYNAGGWVIHHNLDLWRTTWPVGGNGLWAIYQPASGWLLEHMWEHYQFTMDKQFLADNYDLMKGATQFYLDNLQRDHEGYLVTNPSESFENMFVYDGDKHGWACIGATQDMQIIRSLMENTVQSSIILNIDEDFRAQVEKALSELAPMRISPRNGMLQEWNDDRDPLAPLNGQVAHGWALSCDNQISLRKTPELAAALRKTIEHRKPGYSYNSGSWTGSFPALYWARLEEGDSVQRIIDRHFDLALSKNLTSQFTGFWEIDGNLGIAAAIAQMFLQSQDGEVHLLPALATTYPTGSVKGLRARGGYTVDVEWVDGKLSRAKIKADNSGDLQLRHKDNIKTIPVTAGQTIDVDSQLEVI